MKRTEVSDHAAQRFAERSLEYADEIDKQQRLFIKFLILQEIRERPMIDFLVECEVCLHAYGVRLVIRNHTVVTVKHIISEPQRKAG